MVVLLLISCGKDDTINSLKVHSSRYSQMSSGSYDMWFQPESKGLNDKAFIVAFQSKLKSGELDSKSDDATQLNEVIFSLEGLINYEYSDARPTKVLKEDIFELEIPVKEIDAQGEVWIDNTVLTQKYAEIAEMMDVPVEERISMADLDVYSITETTIYARVHRTVSESFPVSFSFTWFDETDQLMAIGQQLIDDPYFQNEFNTTSNQPAHIGYTSTPYPAWIHINDRLNLYYGVLQYMGIPGSSGNWWMGVGEKVWYSNIQPAWLTRYDYSYIDGQEAQCTYGRMGYIYMAGWDSSPWIIGPSSCGCEDAPVPVFAAWACGNYTEVTDTYNDESLNGDRMNVYMQKAMDFIDNRYDSFVQSGVSPNPGIANISYFGSSLPTPCLYGTAGSTCHVRYHSLQFKFGNKELNPAIK